MCAPVAHGQEPAHDDVWNRGSFVPVCTCGTAPRGRCRGEPAAAFDGRLRFCPNPAASRVEGNGGASALPGMCAVPSRVFCDTVCGLRPRGRLLGRFFTLGGHGEAHVRPRRAADGRHGRTVSVLSARHGAPAVFCPAARERWPFYRMEAICSLPSVRRIAPAARAGRPSLARWHPAHTYRGGPAADASYDAIP